MQRPALDHIAVGHWKFEDVVPVVVRELGGRPGRGAEGPGFNWGTWMFGNGGALEVLVPGSPSDSFLTRFLESRGPGIHHVTFKVSNLRQACDHVESKGFRIIGYDDSDPDWREAFIHPREAMGIVVQLGEASPLHEASCFDWRPPPGPPDPPPPVNLLGLRLAAPAAAEARRLWEEALLGEVEERSGGLYFRWPASPLRLAVTLDPSLSVGPLALEIETEREITLPDGVSPESLGVAIIRGC